MSHTASAGKTFAGGSVVPLPEFQTFRDVVVAASRMFPKQNVVLMLDEILQEQLVAEYHVVAATAGLVRHQLERRGDVLTLQLVKANRDHIAGTALVCEKFELSRSTLHREKDAGKVIAYRPTPSADFLFPLEQFEPGKIQKWPATVIKAVGNGAPALHFLYTPRKQLGDESFAAALREPHGRDVSALIEKTAARLEAE